MTQLPGIAAEIEKAIGLDLTMKLLKRRGGTQIAIPVKACGSQLAEIVGVAAAEKIITAIGHGKITLPCAWLRGAKARRAEAFRMLEAGASLLEVALACDMHIRTVSNYRAELEARSTRRQLDLPL